jgi:hypothetical protein
VEALVLKEAFKVSLRCAEGLSLKFLDVRISKFTLHYWEVKHDDIVNEILRGLFRILSRIEYDYSVVDSTEVTDWLKGLYKIFVNVRGGSALFPVHAKLTISEVEFVRGMPEGEGLMLGDGAFDAKPVLNTIASKGYVPVVMRGLTSQEDTKQDRAYNESLYAYRYVGEGVFRALTVEFRGRKKGKKRKQKLNLRIIICCLRILVRWIYE